MHAVASARLARPALALLSAIAVLLLLASAAPAKGDKPPKTRGGAQGTYTETLLSNERDTSRWAFVGRRTSAWSEPGQRGVKLRKLTTRTPDRTSELVLALRERVYGDGTIWTEVRLPLRGSDARGWVARSALEKYRVIHTRIEIDRAALTLTLFKFEKAIFSAAVGVGSSRASTPAGSFYVRNRLESVNPKGRFGPFALGLSAQVAGGSDWPGGRTIGIHGTNRPGRIPGRGKERSIRLRNGDVRKLFAITPPGTPVSIR